MPPYKQVRVAALFPTKRMSQAVFTFQKTHQTRIMKNRYHSLTLVLSLR